MNIPLLKDYVQTLYVLFDEFEQERCASQDAKRGRGFTYPEKTFIVFFLLMQFRRIYYFKSQVRWLSQHPEMLVLLGWEDVPHRKTVSTRYKNLYETLQQFMSYLSQRASELEEAFGTQHLVEDKSLFKAKGPVWHQSDRKQGRIPENLRNLDTDATWSKSGYHGWVYGYGLHITCNASAFPVMVSVETAAVSESAVIDQKAATLLDQIQPETVSADNSYAKATRIRQWAKQGTMLLTPAAKWVNGRYAKAYHRFIKRPECQQWLRQRRTSVEPFFELVSTILGTHALQKQLPLQGLANVRTCLALAAFSVLMAMVLNSIWRLPIRSVSYIINAWT